MEVNPVFRGRDFTPKEDLCFVLIPLHEPFISIFEQQIKPIAEKCGLKSIKADDVYSNKPIMEDVWRYINEARLIIADLTYSNPNVFYELGIAHTLGKEVIMIAQYITKVPFDVEHVRYIDYVYPSRIAQFEADLEHTINEVLRESSSEPSPTIEKRIRTKRLKSPTAQDTRLENLASLTTWATGFTNHNMGIIHNEQYRYAMYSPAAFFDTIHLNIKNEAMRRWRLSAGTAKNYADTVMLTIRDEFKDQVAKQFEVKQRREAEQAEEERQRQKIPFEILRKLGTEGKMPVERNKFIASLIETGKFNEDQANKWLRTMFREGIIYESKPGFIKQLRPSPSDD